MREVTLYSSGIGLNNKVPPHRLPFGDGGVVAFEAADNVIVSRTGEVVTRAGMSLEQAGVYHSLFPGADYGLVVYDRTSDAAIMSVSCNNDVTLGGVRSGLTKGAKVDFCRVTDAVFYTNGYENGMITTDLVSVPWKESEWPDDRSLTGFAAPPVADHLCFNAGRIYFSIDDMVHYTEYGHLGLYDPATNGERLPSRVLVMAPAVDGLYVSDTTSIYFLAGLNPKQWTSRKVADYPAFEWGKLHGVVDPSFMGLETNLPSSVLATRNGPVVCLPGGQLINLIDKNITMPSCGTAGAILVEDETLIIQSNY